MKIGIIIPAYNEEAYLQACLESFTRQTRIPDHLIIVNDNSTDNTAEIALQFSTQYDWISLVDRQSEKEHQPGAKVVHAFNYGLSKLNELCDLIGKFDADIILPDNYFEVVNETFYRNPKLGICSGLLYIQKGDQWIYEAIAKKSHVRGPIKLYRKTCLQAMGGLRPGIGWDTADVLLAEYYGFTTDTIPSLIVKHLRPTGMAYEQKAARFQGRGYYMLRYGWLISIIASFKMAIQKKSLAVFWQSIKGFNEASQNKMTPIVTEEEGLFIRRFRWSSIKRNLF